MCGANAQSCLEKGCIGHEMCNETETLKISYRPDYDYDGGYTIDCCEGDLCNSFSLPHSSGQSILENCWFIYFMVLFML